MLDKVPSWEIPGAAPHRLNRPFFSVGQLAFPREFRRIVPDFSPFLSISRERRGAGRTLAEEIFGKRDGEGRRVTRESTESVSIGAKCREGNEIRLHKGLLPDAPRAKPGPKLAPHRHRGGERGEPFPRLRVKGSPLAARNTGHTPTVSFPVPSLSLSPLACLAHRCDDAAERKNASRVSSSLRHRTISMRLLTSGMRER